MGGNPLINNDILYRIGHGLEYLLWGRLINGPAEHVLYIVHYAAFKRSLIKT